MACTLFIRAAPVVLCMRRWELKLDEEKSKHTHLAWQNGFGLAFQHSLLRLVNGTAELNAC
jgi:hypothetical protein